MVALYLFGGIIILLIAYFSALEFQTIAEMKGHSEKKYSWWSFLVGFVGMLMVQIFKPEKIADFILFMVLGIQFFTAVPGIWLGIKISEKAKENKI